MIAMRPDEIEYRNQQKLVRIYGEDYLKAKGLWDDFLEFAKKEKAKETSGDG